MQTEPIYLDGQSLNFAQVTQVAQGAPIAIAPGVRERVERSRELVRDLLEQGNPIYGVNTGFGYFAKESIDREQLRCLQQHLLKSHASGWGDPLSQSETRLAMALRLNVLCKGYTGVRWELCEALLQLIHHEIYPIVPEYGSVGASGDLAPLSHLALPLIGCGDVVYQGRRCSAAEALSAAGLEPLALREKEGLGLINGTQVMLAVGGLALANGLQSSQAADLAAALSYEALGARISPLHEKLHGLRGQLGQQESAAAIRQALAGSDLCDPERAKTRNSRVQDPYSLRCAPQVHGPSRDALAHTLRIVERELNAATDNPLVFPDEADIVSGGNFHGQALAMAFDIAALALAELGNISERRLELLLNPHFSRLPAFLSPQEGLQSGYMASQYLAASLVNENKLLANPACTDSIPGNVGVEDHVSMGMTSARKLRKLAQNLRCILSIEVLAACQAIDLQGNLQLGEQTASLHHAIRERVPSLTEDRVVADDIATITDDFDKIFKGVNHVVTC